MASPAPNMVHPCAISVIIPVYNNAGYLDCCIESVIQQTFTDLEIIVINDGSTDPVVWPKIAQYAREDARIRAINQPNGGYGHSMNIGLGLARGKYVGIVESDDFIDKYMYEKLFSHSRDEPDIIKCGTVFFQGEGQPIEKHKVTPGSSPISIFADKDYYFGTTPINPSAIYLNSFLKHHKIDFSETPGASYQDIGFNFLSTIFSEEICLVPECMYNYRRDNEDSSINSTEKADAPIYEFSRLHRILESNPGVKEKYIGYLHLKKFRSYRFTLSRIGDHLKKPFLQNFRNEWSTGIANCEIDLSLFSDEEELWIKENLL